MSTLTGLYISQSYGGVIHLSTNTGIVASTPTLLEDGLGNSLGLFIRSNGSISGSSFTGSLAGTASWANNATTASHAINTVSASYSNYAQTASFALNVPTNTASASYLSGSTAIVNNDITIVGGYIEPLSIGYGKAGVANTNIAIGFETLTQVAGGSNIALGFQALKNVSGSDRNIAIGRTTLRDLSVNGSNDNIVIGHESFDTLTRGEGNTIIGNRIGISATNGIVQNNTIVGDTAARDLVNGTYNVGIGYRSLYGLQSGSRNIGIGWETIVPATAESNVAIGVQAGKNFEGKNNVALADRAGLDITTGNTNTILGANTGRGITTGNSNTIVGAQVTGLSSSLSNNIILADGDGNIRARYSGSWTLETALKLTPQNPLPANSVGTLAVSGSNLYYNNGSAWSQIN